MDFYRPPPPPPPRREYGRPSSPRHDSRRYDRYDDAPPYDYYRSRPDHYDGAPPPERSRGRADRYDNAPPPEHYRPRSRSPVRRRRSPSPRRPVMQRSGDDYYPVRSNDAAPKSDMFRFGDDYYPGRSNAADPRAEFTFSSNKQREFHEGAPPRGPRSGPRGDDRHYERNGNNYRRGRGGRGRGGSQYRGPPKAHERNILHANNGRQTTPERLLGMVEGAARFKDVDEIFASGSDGEADMDTGSEGADGQPAKKRTKIVDEVEEVPERPKWSNPDPYFSIPPIDESRGKRKDVVQLIRKAKVEAEKNAAQQANAVTRNIDFIGFGDDENEDDDEDYDNGNDDSAESKRMPDPEVIVIDSGSEDGEIEETVGSRNSNVQLLPKAPTSNGPHHNNFSHKQFLHGDPVLSAAPNGPAAMQPVSVAPVATSKRSQAAVAASASLLDDDDIEEIDEAQFTKKRQRPLVVDPASNLSAADSNKRGKKRKFAAEGDITTEWEAVSAATATPWLREHDPSTDFSERLHEEICDFHAYIKPKDYETEMRKDLIDRVQFVLSQRYRGCRVYPFGSFGQGIFLPTSDMDLVLLSERYQQGNGTWGFTQNARNLGFAVRRLLVEAGISTQEDSFFIDSAKVPIVKFVDTLTGLKCDLSFDNDSGIRALHTFDAWRRTWPFLPQLLSVLKQWLLMRDLNEVFNGGLGGFSLTCMVVSMLQLLSRDRRSSVKNPNNMGELLLEFFDLYGSRFNMGESGISVNPPRIFKKIIGKRCKVGRWTITDPNNSANDLSGGSSRAILIAQRFKDSHKLLTDAMVRFNASGPVMRKGQSLLLPIIGGKYDYVTQQREILLQAHNALAAERNARTIE